MIFGPGDRRFGHDARAVADRLCSAGVTMRVLESEAHDLGCANTTVLPVSADAEVRGCGAPGADGFCAGSNASPRRPGVAVGDDGAGRFCGPFLPNDSLLSASKFH